MERQLYNIFIEGIPGSGKTKLLNRLADELGRDYRVFREGEMSPVELAWCAYMSPEEYLEVLASYPEIKIDIDSNTRRETNRYVTAYTRIKNARQDFYSYMEQYEVYGGRRTAHEFTDIVFDRFSRLNTSGNVFECSFFQNIMDELLLFLQYSDEQVKEFYGRLISLLDMSSFRLIQLVPRNIEAGLLAIKQERTDSTGAEDWFPMVLDYFSRSPYGKSHEVHDFMFISEYYKHRVSLELEIQKMLPEKNCLTLESKHYTRADIVGEFIPTE